jgi:hypothetical protein
MLAALTSGFVGALALASSMYTVYLQRQQVRAAVWPRLDSREESSEDRYKIFVVNRGAGSAIVRRTRVVLDEKPMHSWGEVVRALPHDAPRMSVQAMNDVVGTINPGAEKEMLAGDWATLLALMEAGRSLRVEICYCSSLDECWNWVSTFDGSQDDTIPVQDCRPDEMPFRGITETERRDQIDYLRQWIKSHGTAMKEDAGSDAGPRDAGRE